MDLKHPSVALGPAEALLPCAELQPCLDFFVERLGFRVEAIFPADAPRVASLSGHGLRLRLEPCGGDPGVLRLAGPPGTALTAPNGTRIEFVDPDPPVEVPPLAAGFVLTRAGGGSGAGRAGMLYRDLISDRLGGRFIASHIEIPDGGPVADWVHFHKVAFQMIFCARGWVRVVYEDQGPPFVMQPGDCVLQPPRIRHRVLEASPGLEVVEIGCPALHETLADHDLALPTRRVDPERDFGGQVFLRHVAEEASWTRLAGGLKAQVTGMAEATRGLAAVCVLRAGPGREMAGVAAAELQFGFVLAGSAVLGHAGSHALGRADAFVIPPGEAFELRKASEDFRLLEVTLPA
jgi:quercetin dioxygenase-like cupin family protein